MNDDLFTILLLEDNLDDEETALRALRSCDLRLCVRVARDGVQGLRALGLEGPAVARLPDLILSDYKMPRVDGPEVLRRARADARLRDVPFVVFSSSDEPSDARRCRELGATEYRTKPMAYDEYTTCVREIARRWLAARDGESFDPPAPDVRATVHVGNA